MARSEPTETARSALIKRSALEAAAKLFAERGYSGTNLRDVASVLGISRPGLYYHFPSKERLIEAIVQEVTGSSDRQASSIAARVELDPEEALKLVTHTHAKWILDHGVLFKVIDRSEAELPAHLAAVNTTGKRAVLDSFTTIINRGIDAGLFRPLNARVAAFSIIGMCSWTAWWFRPQGSLSTEEVAEALSLMAMGAVLRTDADRPRNADPLRGLEILRQDIDHLERLLRK